MINLIIFFKEKVFRKIYFYAKIKLLLKPNEGDKNDDNLKNK